MASKSVISDGVQIRLAMQLIGLGARLQLLETETTLSRERLLKLYKEMRGKSPRSLLYPIASRTRSVMAVFSASVSARENGLPFLSVSCL